MSCIQSAARDGNGKCINLGCDYRRLAPSLLEIYNAPVSDSDILAAPESRKTLDRFLAGCCCSFYAIRDSYWHFSLRDRIGSGGVSVCARSDVAALLCRKKTFVFMDQSERRTGLGRDFLAAMRDYPPGLLTSGHVALFNLHGDYLNGIVEAVAAAASRSGRKFVMLACGGDENVFGDILYLLSGQVAAVNKFGIVGCYDSELRYPFLDFYSFRNDREGRIDGNQYAFLVWNIPAGERRNIRCAYGNRTRNCDFYFIHGRERAQDNGVLSPRPFVCWQFPGAGTKRLSPVMRRIMWQLGIDFGLGGFNDARPETLGNNWWLESGFHFDEYRFHNPGSDKAYTEWAELDGADIDYTDKAIALYELMPNAAVLRLHHFRYRMATMQKRIGGKIFVFLRDLRDAIPAAIGFFYGARIKYGGESLYDHVMDFMRKNDNLRRISESLVELAGNPNAFFIKFEDVDADPAAAYLDFFSRAGFTDDPFWIDGEFDAIIERSAEAVKPENIWRYAEDAKHGDGEGKGILRGRPGRWREFFDQRMKDYFKENSNGFLKVFGYERDDNW
jgi:hypothetical protein